MKPGEWRAIWGAVGRVLGQHFGHPAHAWLWGLFALWTIIATCAGSPGWRHDHHWHSGSILALLPFLAIPLGLIVLNVLLLALRGEGRQRRRAEREERLRKMEREVGL